MSEKIDAHHHFWRYNEREYGWMADGMERIQRDFLPPDLEREMAAAGVDGCVTVQARQKLEETEWLLGLAEANDFIRGVVGWVPLVSTSVQADLERLANNCYLKAVRHVLHDEPDDDYMLRDDFNRGVGLLKRFDLAYDILVFERHLPQVVKFVDRHPEQVFVVDHIAKPRIKDGVMSPWRQNISELARRRNVYCKASGMVTEADWAGWTEEGLRPYFDAVLEAFGPERLMFGSDWPVCTVACEYGRWHRIVSEFASALSVPEEERILGGTAAEAYKLRGGHVCRLCSSLNPAVPNYARPPNRRSPRMRSCCDCGGSVIAARTSRPFAAQTRW